MTRRASECDRRAAHRPGREGGDDASMATPPMGPASSSRLEDADIDSKCKTQPPVARRTGCSPRTGSPIDLETDTVTCPAEVTVGSDRHQERSGIANFGEACADLPAPAAVHRQPQAGAPSRISVHEAALARARAARPTRMARRLPGDAPEGRAQARPPHAPQARRTTSPGARTPQVGCRLQPARRSGQPRPAGCAGCLLHPRRGVERGLSHRHLGAAVAPATRPPDAPSRLRPSRPLDRRSRGRRDQRPTPATISPPTEPRFTPVT